MKIANAGKLTTGSYELDRGRLVARMRDLVVTCFDGLTIDEEWKRDRMAHEIVDDLVAVCEQARENDGDFSGFSYLSLGPCRQVVNRFTGA